MLEYIILALVFGVTGAAVSSLWYERKFQKLLTKHFEERRQSYKRGYDAGADHIRRMRFYKSAKRYEPLGDPDLRTIETLHRVIDNPPMIEIDERHLYNDN